MHEWQPVQWVISYDLHHWHWHHWVWLLNVVAWVCALSSRLIFFYSSFFMYVCMFWILRVWTDKEWIKLRHWWSGGLCLQIQWSDVIKLRPLMNTVSQLEKVACPFESVYCLGFAGVWCFVYVMISMLHKKKSKRLSVSHTTTGSFTMFDISFLYVWNRRFASLEVQVHLGLFVILCSFLLELRYGGYGWQWMNSTTTWPTRISLNITCMLSELFILCIHNVYININNIYICVYVYI